MGMQIDKQQSLGTTLAVATGGAFLGAGTEVLKQKRYCKMEDKVFKKAIKHLDGSAQDMYRSIKQGFAQGADEKLKSAAKKLSRVSIRNMAIVGAGCALVCYLAVGGAKLIYNYFTGKNDKKDLISSVNSR